VNYAQIAHGASSQASLVIAGVAAFAIVSGSAFVFGSVMHANEEAAMTARIATEHSRVCAKLGMSPGGPEHALCMTELGNLKTQHENWWAQQNESLL
jgi:hypothetical protein